VTSLQLQALDTSPFDWKGPADISQKNETLSSAEVSGGKGKKKKKKASSPNLFINSFSMFEKYKDRAPHRKLNTEAVSEGEGEAEAEAESEHESGHDTTKQDVVLFLFMCIFIG